LPIGDELQGIGEITPRESGGKVRERPWRGESVAGRRDGSVLRFGILRDRGGPENGEESSE
jgi:hypothetical protein